MESNRGKDRPSRNDDFRKPNRNGDTFPKNEARRPHKTPHRRRAALLCVRYHKDGSCKVEKVILPKLMPIESKTYHQEQAKTYSNLAEVIQDYWVLVSGEAPEGDFMWFTKSL
jgi:hypothetical protein